MKSLKGSILEVDPSPYIVEASPKFDRLALAAPNSGSDHIQIVDVKTRELAGNVDFKGEFKAMCWSADGKSIYVGTKTIGELDVATMKKTKAAFKDGKSPVNALAISTDGKLLLGASGSRVASDDCFVRAFEIETGKLAWKAKPKSQQNGFASIAAHGKLVLSASANRVFAFDAKGAVAAELALPDDAVVGGVASNGTHAAVIWQVKKQLALGILAIDGKSISVAKPVALPLAADPDEHLRPKLATISGEYAIATCSYANVDGDSAHAVFRVKLATAKLSESYELPDTSSVNALRLAYANGQLVWPTDRGVAFAKL